MRALLDAGSRLELYGAHLLARLIGHVSKELDPTVDIRRVYAWSDDQVRDFPRVGGRLRKYELSYGRRHALLLSKGGALVIFGCVACYRAKAATMQPQIGDLPADGINYTGPFSGVGTDFVGKEANLSPLCWRRGRILRLIMGTAGTPRVAEILVDRSILKNARSCICHDFRRMVVVKCKDLDSILTFQGGVCLV